MKKAKGHAKLEVASQSKIEARELHKPVITKYPRRTVMVPAIWHTWSADLIDMRKFERENNHNKYCLTVIDVLSRYAWAEPLKNKQAHTIVMAFQKILQDAISLGGSAPKKLWIDQGSEFLNSQMKRFGFGNEKDCERDPVRYPIQVYHTFSVNKAVAIERFNRTLKTRLWYKFTKLNTHKWAVRQLEGTQ